MKTDNSMRQDWDDLVFENRNREYGAYALRKGYQNALLEAATVSVLIAALAFGLPKLYNHFFAQTFVIKPITLQPIVDFGKQFEVIAERKPDHPQPPPRKSLANVVPQVTNQVVPEDNLPAAHTNDAGSASGTVDGSLLPAAGDASGTGTAPAVIVDNKTLDFAEVMPSYKGGNEAMMKFLRKKLKYPHSARVTDVEGKVYVQFVVNTEGRVSEVKVVRGISVDCDREASRVVALMDGWNPGSMNKRPVSVRMMLPIYFKLN